MDLNPEVKDWLPPSREPMAPPGVGPTTPVWYEPPRFPKPGESRFFLIKQGLRRVANYGWNGAGVPEPIFLEDAEANAVPIVVHARKRMPKWEDEFVNGSVRLISPRVLEVLLAFDPTVVEWRPVVTEFENGRIESCFMRVHRRVHAVDYANTRALYKQSEGHAPYAASCGPARLLPEIPEDVHIFVDARRLATMFVSAALKEKLSALRPPLRNVAFYDPALPDFYF